MTTEKIWRDFFMYTFLPILLIVITFIIGEWTDCFKWSCIEGNFWTTLVVKLFFCSFADGVLGGVYYLLHNSGGISILGIILCFMLCIGFSPFLMLFFTARGVFYFFLTIIKLCIIRYRNTRYYAIETFYNEDGQYVAREYRNKTYDEIIYSSKEYYEECGGDEYLSENIKEMHKSQKIIARQDKKQNKINVKKEKMAQELADIIYDSPDISE